MKAHPTYQAVGCPFCGKRPRALQVGGPVYFNKWYRCDGCSFELPAAKWNRRASAYIGREQIRAGALALLACNGFVAADLDVDVLRSDNMRAVRAVNDVRRILVDVAKSRGDGRKVRAWMRPPRLFGGST